MGRVWAASKLHITFLRFVVKAVICMCNPIRIMYRVHILHLASSRHMSEGDTLWQVVSEAARQLPEEVYKPPAKGTPSAEAELSHEDRSRRRAAKKRAAKKHRAQKASCRSFDDRQDSCYTCHIF